MKAIGKYVLIEQVLTKENKKIFVPGEEAETDPSYEQSLTVIGLGSDVPEGILLEGDKPIMASWAQQGYAEIVEGKNGDNRIVRHILHNYENIIGLK